MPRWALPRLLGPVLRYDLVRTARRSRHLFRAAYAGLVLFALLCTYWLALGDWIHAPSDLFSSISVPAKTMAEFARAFFFMFMILQLLTIFALTPAYLAGVVAQERQRGTLEELLATDLCNREIVLGLLVSRLANVLLLIATGLPILSLTLLWGGVDPRLLAASFAGTGVTAVSLAALSIWLSVYARRPRKAIVAAYLGIIAYLMGTGIVELSILWAPMFGWGTAFGLVVIPTEDPVTLRDLLGWPGIGNPFVMLSRLEQQWTAGVGGADVFWKLLRQYSYFHLSLALLCITLAVARLRSVALKNPVGALQETGPLFRQVKRVRRRRLPRAWDTRGLLWKETAVEARPDRGALGWLWLGVRLALLFWLAGHICYHLGSWLPTGPRFAQLLSFWVRAVAMLMGTFMLLGVAVRAAGSISGERDRRTLDGLLSTPVENRTILFAKWLGSILSQRGAWLRLGIVLAIGILSGALAPLAALCLTAAWHLYAAFLASLGLYFSVVCRSAHRAIIWTLLTAVAAGITPGLAAYSSEEIWRIPLEGYAVVAPVTLGLMAFSPHDAGTWPRAVLQSQEVAIGIQFSIWALAAAGFYVLAGLRFRALTNRVSGSSGVTASAAPKSKVMASASPTQDGLLEEDDWLVVTAGRRWPLHLRNASLLFLPLTLLVTCYSVLMVAAEKDYQAAIAETDRLDPQWRTEELEAQRLVVTDGHNAALQILKAKDLLPKPWDTTGAENAIQNLTPEVQMRPEQVHSIRKALAGAQPALVEARCLKDFSQGRYAVTWSKDGFSTLLPHLQETRKIAKLLMFDALLRSHDQDADGALTSCRALFNAGRSMGDEPVVISLLVRIAGISMALGQVERVLAQGGPSEPMLAALQHDLEEEILQAMLLQSMRGERASIHRFFESLRTGDGSLAIIFGGPSSSLDRWASDALAPVMSGSVKAGEAGFLRNYNQLVEAAKLPPEQQDARFAQIAPPTSMSLLVRLVYPAFNRIVAAFRRSQAQVRCTLAALAVERYRIREGRWPENLAALVPGQLEAVPLDPYDGQPLRYRRLATGVVIYSVGPDLTDDGGKLNRANPSAAGSDIGMRLWNLNRRRQRSLVPL